MRLPSEVEPFTAERRRMRAWFRPARRMPPELTAFIAVLMLAAGFWLMAPAPRPAAVASIAGAPFPVCADAPQPCRGVR